jgi:Helicase conserved C-terminal domain
MKILHDISAEHDRKTIIFVETKRRCDEIARSVNRRGFNAVAIHGDKSQNERDYTLNSFRTGRMNVQILVATDVASRGLGEYRNFLLVFPVLLSMKKTNFYQSECHVAEISRLFFFPIELVKFAVLLASVATNFCLFAGFFLVFFERRKSVLQYFRRIFFRY